jgi:hypothetical protein
MYGWFIKGQGPIAAMNKLFRNPRCNLHEFWKGSGTPLHFRQVTDGSPLCPGPGTLVSDTPFDSFLFGKDDPQAGKMQWNWKPIVVAIQGVGTISGFAWSGVHVMLASKLAIKVPDLRELQERTIVEAAR